MNTIKYACVRCGTEKELEIKVPQTCSKECRLANLGDFQRQRKANRLNAEATASTATQESPTPEAEAVTIPIPPGDEVVNIPPDVPTEFVPEPTEPINEPTPEQPAPPSGGGENTDPGNIGQDTPGEDRVESPSLPVENPEGEQGQA